jgi:hypothetical protein
MWALYIVFECIIIIPELQCCWGLIHALLATTGVALSVACTILRTLHHTSTGSHFAHLGAERRLLGRCPEVVQERLMINVQLDASVTSRDNRYGFSAQALNLGHWVVQQPGPGRWQAAHNHA